MKNKDISGGLIVSLALATAGVISGAVLKKRNKHSISEDKDEPTSVQELPETENIDSFDINSFDGVDDVEDL